MEEGTSRESVEALIGIETELRNFVTKFDCQPEWLWAPATKEMVDAIRPHLARLDEMRAARDVELIFSSNR